MFSVKIWERHFFIEFIKSLLFFLFCFFALYLLIDYANQSASMRRHHIQFSWKEVGAYYLCDFVQRIEVLLPFALLITTIRTLCSLNTHNELVALMSGGISLKSIMRPFILVGFACTLILYANYQWFLPTALKELKHLNENRSRNNSKYNPEALVQHLTLEDGSTLIYGSYDSSQEMFFDAYWVRNIDDIYRIKFLYTNIQTKTAPNGTVVEHLKRSASGDLTKAESFSTFSFHNMRFNAQALFEATTPPEEESLTTLAKKLPTNRELLSEKEAQIETAFFRKLLLPWLCLLAVIAPASFCLRCTRQLPVFFIYAGSIFVLVAFYLLLSAATLLGKRQVMPPMMTFFPLFGGAVGAFLYRFYKL